MGNISKIREIIAFFNERKVTFMKKFYEIDVTNFKKVRLIKIYSVITNEANGWVNKIDNLEMIVDDNNRIILRGWATKNIWNNFLRKLVNSEDLDYIFE